MTKADLGLPSGIQDSTYQQNRAEEKIFLLQKRLGELEERKRVLQEENEKLIAKAEELLRGA